MRYKDFEIDITCTNYSEGVAILPLPSGEIICIPEENATIEEMIIITQIKNALAARQPINPLPIIQPPSQEERIAALEAAIAVLMKLPEV